MSTTDKPKQPPNAFILFLQKQKKQTGETKLSKPELKHTWDTLRQEEKQVRKYLTLSIY